MNLLQIDTSYSLHRRTRLRSSLCGLVLFVATSLTAVGDFPQWWTDRNVLDATATETNDFAAVTQGQLKWITEKARDELNEHGGVGTELEALISSFSPNHNYEAINCGQLKYVAAKFYARLIQLGYTDVYPWTDSPTDNDYALANVGQVKHLFSFDFDIWDSDADGMPNEWETEKGLNPNDPSDAALDPDEDGLANLEEFQQGSDPHNADSDLDGMDDGWEVQNGLNPVSGLSTNLVGWWPLNEESGTNTFDYSGNNLHGVPISSTNLISAAPGYPTGLARPMGSTNANAYTVSIGSNLWADANTFSISCWVLLEDDASCNLIKIAPLLKGTLEVHNGTSLYAMYDWIADLTFSLNTGVWHHIMMGVATNGLSVYTNGVFCGPENEALLQPSGPLTLDVGGSTHEDAGVAMSDIRLYRQVLAPGEIAAMTECLADADQDGLTNLDEFHANTCMTNSDTDADGFPDGMEVQYGSNPSDPGSGLLSVSGSVSDTSGQPGPIIVLLTDTADSWDALHSTTLSQPGTYAMPHMPMSTELWLKAFRDVDGNGQWTAFEPNATYAGNPIQSAGTLTSVALTLSDPDTDHDRLVDSWETQHFGDLSQSTFGDFDHDGTHNLGEQDGSTNPAESLSIYAFSESSATIAWVPRGTPGLSQYYYSCLWWDEDTWSPGLSGLIGDPTTNQVTITELPPAPRYFVLLEARNASGSGLWQETIEWDAQAHADVTSWPLFGAIAEQDCLWVTNGQVLATNTIVVDVLEGWDGLYMQAHTNAGLTVELEVGETSYLISEDNGLAITTNLDYKIWEAQSAGKYSITAILRRTSGTEIGMDPIEFTRWQPTVEFTTRGVVLSDLAPHVVVSSDGMGVALDGIGVQFSSPPPFGVREERNIELTASQEDGSSPSPLITIGASLSSDAPAMGYLENVRPDGGIVTLSAAQWNGEEQVPILGAIGNATPVPDVPITIGSVPSQVFCPVGLHGQINTNLVLSVYPTNSIGVLDVYEPAGHYSHFWGVISSTDIHEDITVGVEEPLQSEYPVSWEIGLYPDDNPTNTVNDTLQFYATVTSEFATCTCKWVYIDSPDGYVGLDTSADFSGHPVAAAANDVVPGSILWELSVNSGLWTAFGTDWIATHTFAVLTNDYQVRLSAMFYGPPDRQYSDVLDLNIIKVELESDKAVESPKPFDCGKTEADLFNPCEFAPSYDFWDVVEEPESDAIDSSLTIYHKEVSDASGDVQDFDIKLRVLPDGVPTAWSLKDGPAGSGSLTDADQSEATFSDPTKGGRYVFTAEVGDITTDVQVWLPISGPDISAEFQNQINYIKNDWGPRYQANLNARVDALVPWFARMNMDLSTYLALLWNQRVDDLLSFGLNMDYELIDINLISDVCGLANVEVEGSAGGDRDRFSMKGASRWYVTDFSKRSNMAYAMAARAMGFPSIAITEGPDLYLRYVGDAVGTRDTPAAKESYRAAIDLIDGQTLQQVMDARGRAMQEPSGRSRKEWPDATPASTTYLDLNEDAHTTMEALTVAP